MSVSTTLSLSFVVMNVQVSNAYENKSKMQAQRSSVQYVDLLLINDQNEHQILTFAAYEGLNSQEMPPFPRRQTLQTASSPYGFASNLEIKMSYCRCVDNTCTVPCLGR
jgi:hypothetical protein